MMGNLDPSEHTLDYAEKHRNESAAYRDGLQDGKNATDGGVDVWADGRHAGAYGRGVRQGIAMTKTEAPEDDTLDAQWSGLERMA